MPWYEPTTRMYKRILCVIPNNLERFFRNLILGETNELRNRYMVVNAPEGLVAEPVRPVNRTSSLFIASLIKQTIIIERINGESRIETSPNIPGELYKRQLLKQVLSKCYIQTSPIILDRNIADGKRVGII